MIVIKTTKNLPKIFDNKKSIGLNFEARIIKTIETVAENSETPEKDISFLVEGHIELDKTLLFNNNIEKIDIFLYSNKPSDSKIRNKRTYASKLQSNKLSRKSINTTRNFNNRTINHESKSRNRVIEKNKTDKFNRKLTSLNVKQIFNFEKANKKSKKSKSDVFGNNTIFTIETNRDNMEGLSSLKFERRNLGLNSSLIKKTSSFEKAKDFNDPSSINFDLNSNLNKKTSNAFLRLPSLRDLELSNGTSRSAADVILGRFENRSISSLNIKDQNDFSKMIYEEFLRQSFGEKKEDYVIKKEKRENSKNVLRFEFLITKKDLRDLESSLENFFIFKAYNSQGVLFDSFFQEYDFSKLRKQINFVNISNIDLSTKRSGQFVILSATNNSDLPVTIRIFKRTINFQNKESRSNFELFKDVTIKKKSSISLKSIENSNDEIDFRVTPVFENIDLNNSLFVSVKSENRKTRFYDKNCKFSVINNKEFMTFIMFSCSSDVVFARVVKRNLTKKQKNFEVAKTISSFSDSEQQETNTNSLLEHTGFNLFNLNTRKNGTNFSFYDYDVEDENIYEYKLLLTLKNGEITLSNQSFIEKYEKPSGEVLIEGSISKLSNQSSSISDSKKIPGGLFSVSIDLSLTTKTNKKIQEFFGSLSRNAYESLKSQINEIKEAVNKNYLLTIEMSSTKTGESYNLGDYFLNEDNKLVLNSVLIPAAAGGDEISSVDYNAYVFKVTPKVVNYYEYIDSIYRNVEQLALLDRFKNNSDFDFLRNKIKLEKNTANIKSENFNKYARKKAKLKGLLPPDKPRSTEVGSEVLNLDAKSTGDFFYKIIKNAPGKKEIESSFEGFFEFPRSFEKKNKKSLDHEGILSFTLSGENAFVDLDYLALHSFSRDKFNFHGKLFHGSFGDLNLDDSDLSLKSYIKMKNFVGYYVFFVVPFYTDGSIGKPIAIQKFKIDSHSLEII